MEKQFEIKDSGERRVFDSGAHRDRVVGKGAFNLLPFHGIEAVARVFEGGAIKYSKNNWRLGMPVSEFINSGCRHGVKAANGWQDEDHLAMAAWNFLCAIETKWMVSQGYLPKELDDVDDFLTPDGIKEAFKKIKEENANKKKNNNANQ